MASPLPNRWLYKAICARACVPTLIVNSAQLNSRIWAILMELNSVIYLYRKRRGVSAANPHLLRFSQICPRMVTFGPFHILRRHRRPPDHSPGMKYIIVTCWIQRSCPFIVKLPRSDDLPGIAICRWCTCATQIGLTFFQNWIYVNLFRQIQTLRCIYVHPP